MARIGQTVASAVRRLVYLRAGRIRCSPSRIAPAHGERPEGQQDLTDRSISREHLLKVRICEVRNIERPARNGVVAANVMPQDAGASYLGECLVTCWRPERRGAASHPSRVAQLVGAMRSSAATQDGFH